MPNYEFTCLSCDRTEERNVPIAERESQSCEACGSRLNRVWAFSGSVWAPTSTGSGHK